MILTTGSLPTAGQFMPSVVRPCLCSPFNALHIGAPEAGFWCSFFNLSLHAFASIAVNLCCLESKITGAGVSPASLISAPRGVVGSAPRMDLACRFRRSWRSSRLATSLGSHQSSLPYSATTWSQAIWTALTLFGRTPHAVQRVRSLASAALAFFIHQWWCSLKVRSVSIQMTSQRVDPLLNRIKPSPTLIFAVSFGWRCFLWPRLCVNSAASVLAVSHCSPLRLGHSILFCRRLFKFRDDLIDVASSCYPAEVFQERESFG